MPGVSNPPIGGGSVNVEDDAYGAGWNGDTTNAPTQNAVFDKIEAHLAADEHPNTFAWNVEFGDGSGVLATGYYGQFSVPRGGTITSYEVVADQSGSVQIDVWKDTYTNLLPTDADSITASAPIALSTAQKATDSTLTGWTTAFSAEDWFAFNVDSAATVTHVTVVIRGTYS